MKPAPEKFEELYHKQPGDLTGSDKFAKAKTQFEESHGLQSPYSSYESFKAAHSRKHKRR